MTPLRSPLGGVRGGDSESGPGGEDRGLGGWSESGMLSATPDEPELIIELVRSNGVGPGVPMFTSKVLYLLARTRTTRMPSEQYRDRSASE